MLNTAQQQFDGPAYAMTRGSIVASVRGKKLTVNGDVDHGRRWASRLDQCIRRTGMYIYRMVSASNSYANGPRPWRTKIWPLVGFY